MWKRCKNLWKKLEILTNNGLLKSEKSNCLKTVLIVLKTL